MSAKIRCLLARCAAAGGLLISASGADAAPAIHVEMPGQPPANAVKKIAEQAEVILFLDGNIKSITDNDNASRLRGSLAVDKEFSYLPPGSGVQREFLNERSVTLVLEDRHPEGEAGQGKVPLNLGEDSDDRSYLIAPAQSQEKRIAIRSGSSSNSQCDSGTPSDKQSKSKGELEEIIVTARKREENLQNVPFGISALTTKDLERTGSTGMEDYLSQVPGVHYAEGGRGRSGIRIRGVATGYSNDGDNSQPTVEIYLDELPLTDRFSNWLTPDIDTFDVERVEVLRGPQGTLFGSGALGGAIRLVTNKPDFSKVESKIEMGFNAVEKGGRGDAIRGVVNVPLIEDKLALRLVGFRRRDAGYIDNIAIGKDSANDGYARGGRVMLAYKPLDALNMRFTLHGDDEELGDDPSSFRFAEDGARNQHGYFGASNSNLRLRTYNFTADYSFDRALLTSTTTAGTRNSFYNQEDNVRVLGTAFGIGYNSTNNQAWIKHRSRKFAHEMRLASTRDSRTEWTIGAYLFKNRQPIDQLWSAGDPDPIELIHEAINIDVREAAAFGEATYHFTERWSATAGARWFDNKFTMEVTDSPNVLIPLGMPRTTTPSRATNPKFSVSYHPSDTVHLYATASKGYRIGQSNFNAGFNPVIPPGYGPDSLWNYELGTKSTWFSRRLRTDVAAFYIDWTNIQVNGFVLNADGSVDQTSNHIKNGGNATIKGIEGEFIAYLGDSLELGTSLTYTDAKLRSVAPGVLLTPGSVLPGTPKFGATTYVQDGTKLTDNMDGYLRLTHYYVGKVFGGIDNTIPDTTGDAYNRFDMNTGVNYRNYEFSLYLENILNDHSVIRGLGPASPDVGLPATVIRLKPRTVGITGRVNF